MYAKACDVRNRNQHYTNKFDSPCFNYIFLLMIICWSNTKGNINITNDVMTWVRIYFAESKYSGAGTT